MDNRQKELSNYRIQEAGRRLGTLKQLREKSDYDDFYMASREQAEGQLETANRIIEEVKAYLAL